MAIYFSNLLSKKIVENSYGKQYKSNGRY